MKKTGKVLAPVLALLLVFVLCNSLYTVQPKEYVAVRQFGRIVNVVDTPGLKAKIPFVQTIQRISAATILYDIPASDIITKDKKSMISDNYVLWRVTDPTLYIQTLNAIEARAAERIEAAVYNSLKKILSNMTQDEIIAARGERLTQLITEDANGDIRVYGIEIIQSEIKALDLPEDNKAAVFTRMISERENIAAGYTAEGAAEAQKIRNETDRKVTVMTAEAEKEAATILAEGESEYMRILQDAYNTDDKADFYNYTRSLDALKASMTGGPSCWIRIPNSPASSTATSRADPAEKQAFGKKNRRIPLLPCRQTGEFLKDTLPGSFAVALRGDRCYNNNLECRNH